MVHERTHPPKANALTFHVRTFAVIFIFVMPASHARCHLFGQTGLPALHRHPLRQAGFLPILKHKELLEVLWKGKNTRQKIFIEFYTRGLTPTAIIMSLLWSFFQT